MRAYIEKFLMVFPDRDSARSYAARLIAGGAPPPRAGGAPPPPAGGAPAAGTTTTKEIEVGMTALEVIELLGRPDKEITFGNSTKWTYPDLTVIFESGRVKEVRF